MNNHKIPNTRPFIISIMIITIQTHTRLNLGRPKSSHVRDARMKWNETLWFIHHSLNRCFDACGFRSLTDHREQDRRSRFFWLRDLSRPHGRQSRGTCCWAKAWKGRHHKERKIEREKWYNELWSYSLLFMPNPSPSATCPDSIKHPSNLTRGITPQVKTIKHPACALHLANSPSPKSQKDKFHSLSNYILNHLFSLLIPACIQISCLSSIYTIYIINYNYFIIHLPSVFFYNN